MKIKLTNSTMVKPLSLRPTTNLWLSTLDIQMPTDYHVPTLYFYRFTGGADFFDPAVLKAALSRAMVEFYPIAGRLQMDNNGRIEINCNGEGLLFMEAEADGEMGDLGDFGPKPELGLIPTVDYSLGISTYPIVLLQVTRFKCGGVCLGVGYEHHISDGYSAIHFINTWSDIARGLNITIPAFWDRTDLRPQSPPNPRFTHIEFHASPQIKTPQNDTNHSDAVPHETVFSTFKLTRDHLNALKANCKDEDDDGKAITYSTYEVLAGHAWRCVCKARGLPENQETWLSIPVDGRFRLQPPLPKGYFANVIFTALPIALCGELQSNPLKFAVGKIHNAIARMDNDYLRSAIDYLELLPSEIDAHSRGMHLFKSPNLLISNWSKLPMYDADFGWGKPVHMGAGAIPPDGITYVMPNPTNDGGVLYALSLPKEQMELFEKLFNDI
ncbi:hypothetical protein DH2020_013429 [Rehmannia glutinosa]|uniref:Shikimate O-hydroxycinnamoyltransferase n=1 Tax=Rehmannia glutinosa TaxID=99300 RepID=A0ABR0X5T4_REHGL